MRVPLQHLNRSMQSLHNRGLQIHGVAIDRENMQGQAPTDSPAEVTPQAKAQEKTSGQKTKRSNRRKRG